MTPKASSRRDTPYRECAHVTCTRWARMRGICDSHYRSTLAAGLRAAAGDRLSPSLRKASR